MMDQIRAPRSEPCSLPPGLPGRFREYLRWVVCPLTVHEELVLMLALRQVQDGDKVVVAAKKRKRQPSQEVSRKTSDCQVDAEETSFSPHQDTP